MPNASLYPAAPEDHLLLKTDEYGPLISPYRDRETPIYNWHAFKHSYSKALVKKLASEFNLNRHSLVLDPFCGGGTTLLACKEMGINSEGFDILPFSVFLSNVKTRSYNPHSLVKYFDIFQEKKNISKNNFHLPDIKIIREAFSPEIKNEVLRLKSIINMVDDPSTRDFYMLGLLSILESISNTTKSGGFLRIEKKHVPKGEVQKQFLIRIQKMIDDVKIFNKTMKFSDVEVSAKIGDSRILQTEKKFDAIITSPPYPNRHDYTRIYGLELIVGFIKDHNELKQIRYNTLRSHVEAKKRFDATDYKKPEIIDALIIKVKKAGLNNSQVPEMLEGYFEDMYLSLLQMKKHLKRNGKLALVVSNVRFGGVNIPVDSILSKIGDQAGLTTKSIIVARQRGNSAQQMKQFKRVPSRESIIIWENT